MASTVSKKSSVTKKPKTHPPYAEMVKEAIVALKEKTGSSQYAIAKHIEDNQKDLPVNFKKLLLVQLKKLVAAGKLTKVKNSFKLASVEKAKKPATEKKAPATKVPAKKALVVKKAAKAGSQVKVVKAKAKTPVKAKKVVKKAAPAKKPKSIKSPVKKVVAKKAKK
ncbi:hypothetical protein L1987_78630 [Smallanthus sonchifolius]|uniref:Uncharacterized protein n=1 Tax=Smallanthus sonchifolius TaxID=185202 RepID=A0ACB8ZD12_9ASTR|nr:hypothetical protein L1987_78630 [Smallanthus sonchifolius]